MYRFILALIVALPLTLTAGSLKNKVKRDLKLLNLPAPAWGSDKSSICDVAVIGAGQAGLSIAYALTLEGVENVRVFDSAPSKREGPWMTTARMPTLRSDKNIRGPARLPNLTFRAWCEATHGKRRWKKIKRIPTKTWGKYLCWLRKITGARVSNNRKLERIQPNPDNTLTLHFKGKMPVQCRKVILATGRSGFGGPTVPQFMRGVPRKFWAHTSETIPTRKFRNKNVVVIGVGASGFDVAAHALERGAKSVKMLMRRKKLPSISYSTSFNYPGFLRGFYYLPDDERIEFFTKAFKYGVPPTKDSIKRLKPFSGFKLKPSTSVENLYRDGSKVIVATNRGKIKADFIVLATGYAVNGEKQKELSPFFDKVMLWKDRTPKAEGILGRFAYLGSHFEFMEKVPGQAPYLSNIHCFNYGAFLSHGRICGDIESLPVGVEHLVDAICIDLFLQDTCCNGSPIPYQCPGSCQSGECNPNDLHWQESD